MPARRVIRREVQLDYNLAITLPDTEIATLSDMLKKQSISHKIRSKSEFAPVNPDQIIHLIVYSGDALIPFFSLLFSIFRKTKAVLEPDSELEIAKKFYADRWPFSTIFMECEPEKSYFVFKRGSKKFYWKRVNDKITAGEL